MKKFNKKIVSLALSVAIIISMLITHPIDVYSETKKPGFSVSECTIPYEPSHYTMGFVVANAKHNAKITVKSSNNNIASIRYDKYTRVMYVTSKKTGKVTLTCTVKQNGKKYVSKCNFKIIKYKNPLSKCIIGNKDYKNKFNKKTTYDIKDSKKKQKIYIKPKKGYKLNRIYYINYNSDKIEVQNNEFVNFNGLYTLYIELLDKKGNPITIIFY